MKFVSFFTLILLLTACSGSADKKVPELVNEMCGCFSEFDKELSEDSRKLLKEVSVAADPQSEMLAGMKKLKQEDAVKFTEKLKSIGDKNSSLFKCMQEFDKKHGKETTKDKKALTERLLKEMRQKGDCPVGAAILSMSLKRGIQ